MSSVWFSRIWEHISLYIISLITLFFRFRAINLSRNIKAQFNKTNFCTSILMIMPNYIWQTHKRILNGKSQSFADISGKAESSSNISGLQGRNATRSSVLFCRVWEHISPYIMSLITLFFRFRTINLSRNIKAQFNKTNFCASILTIMPNYIRHTRKRILNDKSQSFAVISGKAESSSNISGLQTFFIFSFSSPLDPAPGKSHTDRRGGSIGQ